MREKLASLLFLIVLVFLGVFSYYIFKELFFESNLEFSNSAYAAFLGAFLAFLFVRIGDFLKAFSDRLSRNYNALVKFDHILNSLYNDLDDNIYVVEIFESLYQENIKAVEEKRIFIWANRLHPVRLFDDLILELLNMDLTNELFALNIHLRKFNDSADTINRAYTESKEALISGSIEPKVYIDNLGNTHRHLLDIKSFLISYSEEIKEAISAVRVLCKRKTLMGSIFARLPGRNYSRDFDTHRQEQLKILEEEMTRTRKSSGEKIESVLNKK